ncbi:TPA: ATP-binding protein [Vibrio parahaemolyticus]|uniref:AAA family ATPase n=1 Tax=Vibrio parahaemolyticus TaxID=670 RepID=UPI0015DF9D4A|nr:ATP-binding protein [Vibrio parahaemolyticus]EHK7402514.1 ATP-binding protein [Vibrio parahaemolyticus]MBO0166928.1 ATP-binding protein [Vibrio parahaemolyticus]MDF4752423.1 ATP-binding protein [Vibrio parahaemolyticus]MDF4779283.1 ATP-binding protein [Vibrio parahaemolyticus]MDF4785175.1 ATP-binding protein [Vibrio parahaemolyticus]
MLVDLSVQNFASINEVQELSMVASTSTNEKCELDNTYELNRFGVKEVLKSAAIFGANGSGKTNIVMAISVLKNLVLDSLSSNDNNAIKRVVPFLLKENYFDVPSEFEVSFLAEGNLYRYGIAIENGEIEEEWLYWTKTSRETMLFHREKQAINYNQRSFSEAKLFTKKEGDRLLVDKTKPTVPFISVLSQFDGEKSVIVTDWFNKVQVISGLRENAFKRFTVDLFQDNEHFKEWALEILSSLQIDDINVVEFDRELPIRTKKAVFDEDLRDAFSTLEGYFEKNKIKDKRLEIVKRGSNSQLISLPMSIESEGTQKLIYLLGPLYDLIINNEILIIDEFDNKFHTLLCKFIIELYNKKNVGSSQIILTCHDTNLLTSDLFRRDQIWFVEKNERHESEIYSLVEYKEHYTRKGNSYSRDYLQGKYGAIPLFSNLTEFEEKVDV